MGFNLPQVCCDSHIYLVGSPTNPAIYAGMVQPFRREFKEDYSCVNGVQTDVFQL